MLPLSPAPTPSPRPFPVSKKSMAARKIGGESSNAGRRPRRARAKRGRSRVPVDSLSSLAQAVRTSGGERVPSYLSNVASSMSCILSNRKTKHGGWRVLSVLTYAAQKVERCPSFCSFSRTKGFDRRGETVLSHAQLVERTKKLKWREVASLELWVNCASLTRPYKCLAHQQQRQCDILPCLCSQF